MYLSPRLPLGLAPARASAARRFFTSSSRHLRSPFGGPSPPRLPEAEQKLFEDLQRSSTGAFSTPRPRPQVNQSPASSPSSSSSFSSATPFTKPGTAQSPSPADTSSSSAPPSPKVLGAKIQAQGDGEELHPNVRRGAPPEFEGDRNPRTGEVGGPKNDPLRWGGAVDWSYNGRVTDF